MNRFGVAALTVVGLVAVGGGGYWFANHQKEAKKLQIEKAVRIYSSIYCMRQNRGITLDQAAIVANDLFAENGIPENILDTPGFAVLIKKNIERFDGCEGLLSLSENQ